MKNKWKISGAIMAFLVILAAGSFAAFTTLVHFETGGAMLSIESGGEIEINSGGSMDVESGASLKLAGTAISASAAEINYTDGTTLGTSVASKILGLSADRGTNYLAITDTLYLDSALGRVITGSTIDFESGSSLKIAGTAVSASAAELNYIDGTTLGTSVASKALGLSADRATNFLGITDSLYTDSALVRITTGSTIDIESGGAIKIAGTSISASAAEINYIDGTVLGTSVASKALGLDANRAVNFLGITDSLYTDSALIRVTTGSTIDVESGGSLKIAGTAVSASAAELNYIDGTTLGTSVASKALGLSADRGTNYLAVTDTIYTDSALIRVTSGSTIDVESGGALKIAGTQVTASAAEINKLAGVTAGTSKASAALVLGTTRNVNQMSFTDSLSIDTGIFLIASGATMDVKSGGIFAIAGTQVTSSAAELNLVDGSVVGTAVASKALSLSADRGANYLALTDTLYFDSGLLRVTTGSTAQVESGGVFNAASGKMYIPTNWPSSPGAGTILVHGDSLYVRSDNYWLYLAYDSTVH